MAGALFWPTNCLADRLYVLTCPVPLPNGCVCMWVNNVIYYALLSGISGIYRARDTTHKCCHKFCTAAPQETSVCVCVCVGRMQFTFVRHSWLRLLRGCLHCGLRRYGYFCSNNLQFICRRTALVNVCVCGEKQLPLTPPPFCWRAANAILQKQQHGVERNANANCRLHATCPESRGSSRT